jgi:hypothetical protein
MRLDRPSAFADAVPYASGPGRRTPAVRLVLDERDKLFREAARCHCVGMSDRQAAATLRSALLRYQTGRWRRTRVETTCPEPRDRLASVLWMLLRVRDAIPSERTIRSALSRADASQEA